MTSYDIAADRGRKCFLDGGSLYDNPFDKYDDWFLHEAWNSGFLNDY